MTKSERSPNAEVRKLREIMVPLSRSGHRHPLSFRLHSLVGPPSDFDIRHSDLIRHSSFVIRHSRGLLELDGLEARSKQMVQRESHQIHATANGEHDGVAGGDAVLRREMIEHTARENGEEDATR